MAVNISRWTVKPFSSGASELNEMPASLDFFTNVMDALSWFHDVG